MKLDDADYHAGAAVAAGQPAENAFVHIGLFLGWLIRHDLVRGDHIPADHLAAVRDGWWVGSDLADDVDQKLMTDDLTEDGAAFAAARYEAYLGVYNEVFADLPDYAVADDVDARARIEAAIDRLYAEWVTAGRPAAAEPQNGGYPDPRIDPSVIPWDSLPAESGVLINADGSWSVLEPEPDPHVAPKLEALLGRLTSTAPAMLSSTTAAQWGSSVLNRVAKDLGLRPRDVMVATLIGRGDHVTASAYALPGIPAARLREAFSRVVVKPPGRKAWTSVEVSGTEVAWADGSFSGDNAADAVAYWAHDGLVVSVAGTKPAIVAAIDSIGHEALPRD